MTTEQFLGKINYERLNNKNRWYFMHEIVNGKEVYIKAYGTYLQIFTIDGMKVPTGMEMNVGQFKTAITNAFKEAK